MGSTSLIAWATDMPRSRRDSQARMKRFAITVPRADAIRVACASIGWILRPSTILGVECEILYKPRDKGQKRIWPYARTSY